MAERFELFRLSLLPRSQRSFLDQRELTREQYLREVLAAGRTFKHYGVQFHYVPAVPGAGDILLARIGRSVQSQENEPPDHELIEVIRDTWKAAVLVVDPNDHGDGQKVALQFDPKVGKPKALLESFISALNEANPEAGFDIEAAPIIDAESFWDFARANEGQLTTLKFEFVAPNMFGGHDSVTEDLRDFRNAEGAQRVDLALTSKDGLRTDTERVKESVEYAVKGGGVIRARTKRGKRFNSAQKIRTTVIDEAETEEEPKLVRAARWVTRILGHE